jgi:hypothetical protein
MFFYIESYHLLDYYYGNQNSCSFNIILHIFLWKTQKHNVRIWTTDIYKVAEIGHHIKRIVKALLLINDV